MCKQVQPLRWLEYSVTSACMMISLLSLSRVSNAYLLASMFLLSVYINLTGGLCGDLLKVASSASKDLSMTSLYDKTRVIFVLVAWLTFVLQFVLLWETFETAIGPYLYDLSTSHLWEQLWGFIRVLNVSLLVAYTTFPVLHLVQTLGPSQWYLPCEAGYIVCSCVSKSLLTLIVMVSATQRG